MSSSIPPLRAEGPGHPGSKNRLRPGAERHYPSDSAFDRIARVVCRAGCIPRKELHESWEVAKRVRRHLRGTRIVDLACGHGLLAWILAVLTPRAREVLAVDRRTPPSAASLDSQMRREWPELARRVVRHEADIREIPVRHEDVVVCAHGCGSLTDRVLDLALGVRAHVAVLPCCSDHSRLDAGGLGGWLGPDLAIDVMRAVRLREAGYKVWTLQIAETITPKNRLLMGRPRERADPDVRTKPAG